MKTLFYANLFFLSANTTIVLFGHGDTRFNMFAAILCLFSTLMTRKYA